MTPALANYDCLTGLWNPDTVRSCGITESRTLPCGRGAEGRVLGIGDRIAVKIHAPLVRRHIAAGETWQRFGGDEPGVAIVNRGTDTLCSGGDLYPGRSGRISQGGLQRDCGCRYGSGY